MLEYVLLVPALLLLFFLPGYTLVQALFPCRGELDSDDDIVFRLSLGVILSIVITGSAISLLSLQPGRPMTPANIAAAPAVLSAVLFAIGYWRGAYPWLGGREAPAAAAPVLPVDDIALKNDLEAKLKFTLRDLERAQRSAAGPTRNPKAKARAMLLQVERDLLLRQIELLETPEDLRRLHERAQVLVRRWGRIDRAISRSRPSPRRESLEKARARVEAELLEVHAEIAETEGAR